MLHGITALINCILHWIKFQIQLTITCIINASLQINFRMESQIEGLM